MTDDAEAIRAELAKTGRAYIRARKALPNLVLRAYAAGLRYADISRAADHAITPERVRQIIEKDRADKPTGPS